VVTKDQVLNERYRLLSLEGEGAMADVYKAHDLALDRTVAIKILRSEYDAGEAFLREARAAAKLTHPNIVTVYDVGQEQDVRYIVMEYAEGQTLEEILRARGPLRVSHVLNILLQVCDAVGFVHEQGIIHCDIKPQNILVQPDGKAQVTDFGIARALSSGTSEQRGKLWGTPYYASPELVAGRTLTPASDVYAIGVMLYEMLCGKRPFSGDSAADIARQHVMNAPPPIQRHSPSITRYLRQVVDRTLAKDPTARYRTAADLGKALRVYRQHSTSATQPLQPIPVASHPQAMQPLPETPPSASGVPAVPERRPGVDWVMFLLGALAFLSIMGLLPIWGTVLTRALAPLAPAPTATASPSGGPSSTATQDLTAINTPAFPTATSTPQVTVPNLIGQDLEAARQLARDVTLALTIDEQRHDAEVPAGHITAQHPPAGEQVAPSTEIGIVLSLGPEMVNMPDIIGFPAAISQLNLEDIGLTVSITETWSTEPVGLVISQTPAASTAITVGSTVTLTVSSGPQGRVDANFDNKLRLLTCEFSLITPRPGDAVQMVITWQVLERLPAAYTVFIHVVDQDGRMLTQRDQPPLGGSRPTDSWQAGERLLDPYNLSIPSHASPGSYQVLVGLYRGDSRLPVVDPGFAEEKGNAILVRRITIE
jgi:eukaryotic-like serine/threonine-protein kinase